MERLSGLVHAQKDIVPLEPFGNVKEADIGDPQTCVDRNVDEVLRILSIPGSESRSWIGLRKNLVAGSVDPFKFLVLKGRFWIQFRSVRRRLQIVGDVLGQPFSLQTELDESFESFKLFGFAFLGILPAKHSDLSNCA